MIEAVCTFDIIKTHTGEFRKIRDTLIPIWNSTYEIGGEQREDIMEIFTAIFGQFKDIIAFDIPYIARWTECLKDPIW